MFIYRKIGQKNIKLGSVFLKFIGVFPIINHYYEPKFKYLNYKSGNRNLPGIKLNIQRQLSYLKNLKYANELDFMNNSPNLENKKFSINNSFFTAGDAEVYYQIIRHNKPKKIIEIGSGQSTLVAIKALEENFNKNNIKSKLICIEPYENKWLSKLKIEVIRKEIENINFNHKKFELNKGDILFIDSSHIIKPDGDLTKIYLEIFPKIKRGVIIHIHDIFTPRNYLKKWLLEEVLFWNEQYMLEAILANSNKYRILLALNFLKNNYFKKLKKVCPFLLTKNEPGSFYIVKK